MFFLTTVPVFAAEDGLSTAVEEKIKNEIHYAGYECEQVNHIEIIDSWFFGKSSNVICDKVFRFILRYERGGVSVMVE